MKLLLWAFGEPEKLPSYAKDMIEDVDNTVFYSTAAVWEVTIKNARDKPDFRIDPHRFRAKLFANEFLDFNITSDHALAVASLPPSTKAPSTASSLPR